MHAIKPSTGFKAPTSDMKSTGRAAAIETITVKCRRYNRRKEYTRYHTANRLAGTYEKHYACEGSAARFLGVNLIIQEIGRVRKENASHIMQQTTYEWEKQHG